MISIKHRWYFLSALLCIVLFHPSTASNCGERPVSNTVLFATKVQESPIILIGTSMNKLIDPNVPNLFNVSFLVECILKGRPTQRLIQIVQAGERTYWDLHRSQHSFLHLFRISAWSPLMPTIGSQSTIHCLSRRILRWNVSTRRFRGSTVQ